MADYLQAINSSRMDWRIRVRVTRVWESVSWSTNTIIGYNLLLIDCNNYRIHAWMKPEKWNLLQGLIFEGGIFDISMFLTLNSTGMLRPVSSPNFIRFLNNTTVEPVLENIFSFPHHGFEFVSINDLHDIGDRNAVEELPTHTIDVIGVIEFPGEVKMAYTSRGNHLIHAFQVTDGHVFVKVVLWGEILLQATNVLFGGNLAEPIVIVLAGVQLKIFRTGYSLMASPWTRVYINMETDDVRDMRLEYGRNFLGI